jgi:para-nitrobenzyl esterase
MVLLQLLALVSCCSAVMSTLVRGWSSGSSQGAWCGEHCLLSNAAKLLVHNMTLEVDPFMQITASVWPTVVAEGWWQPGDGGGGKLDVDANGRALPAPDRFGAHGTAGTAASPGLGPLCAGLHALRGVGNAGGLRCGIDLVLGVPRTAVAAGSPVLGAPHATATTVANQSDPMFAHHFGLNASAPGAVAYAQSLAQLLKRWQVDHVKIVGGARRERWQLPLRAFAAEFMSAEHNRTSTNKRTLAIGSEPDEHGPTNRRRSRSLHRQTEFLQRSSPEPSLLPTLLQIADSVAIAPPIWDTWPHLLSTLRQAELYWGQHVEGLGHAGRLDIGTFPIGRLGARADGGKASYPPWHPGSCTPAQLGCGDSAAAGRSPECCPRQSRLSAAESRFVYALALAANSPLMLGGSLLGQSNSMPSMMRFTLPDHGAYAYSRSPLVGRPLSVRVRLNQTGNNCSIVCRGTSSTNQPRIFDYEWMCCIFNTGNSSLHLRLDLATLPLDASASGNATGRDYMLNSLLGSDGPSGAFFGGRPLQIGEPTDADRQDNSTLQLGAHDSFAFIVERVRVGRNENLMTTTLKTDDDVRSAQAATAAPKESSAATTNDAGASDADAMLTVQTTSGRVRGLYRGASRSFLGIPFAAPPVGQLRFAMPTPPARWNHTRDATRLSDRCIQLEGNTEQQESEDCLHLNVFTPRNHSTAAGDLPVLVYIHGGGQQSGCSADFYGDNLAEFAGMVVVVIQYRLNIFGYFVSEEMLANGASNLGLLDQVQALKWVQANVKAFGGDPKSVLVSGQSSGCSSVGFHLVYPQSWDLYARAAMMSCAMNDWQPQASLLTHGADISRYLGCDNNAAPGTVLSCLRALNASAVFDALLHTKGAKFDPCYNCVQIPTHPLALMREGKVSPSADVMLGNARFEHGTVAALHTFGLPNSAMTAQQYAKAVSKVVHSANQSGVFRNASMTAGAIELYAPLVDRLGYWYALATMSAHSNVACSQQYQSRWLAAAFQGTGTGNTRRKLYRYVFTHVTADWPARPELGIGGRVLNATHTAALPYLFRNASVLSWFLGYRSFTQQERDLSDQIATAWSRFASSGETGVLGWQQYDRSSNFTFVLDSSSPKAIADGPGWHDENEQYCAFWERRYISPFPVDGSTSTSRSEMAMVKTDDTATIENLFTSNCVKQLKADGCLLSLSPHACGMCAEKHRADLAKAKCSKTFVTK